MEREPPRPIGLQQLSTKSKAAHKVVTMEGQVRPSEHRSQPCARRVPLEGDLMET